MRCTAARVRRVSDTGQCWRRRRFGRGRAHGKDRSVSCLVGYASGWRGRSSAHAGAAQAGVEPKGRGSDRSVIAAAPLKTMDDDSIPTAYIIVGVRSDGGVPAMDIVLCRGDGDAILKARTWFAEHRSCVGAQVWRDAILIGEVADPKEGPSPADDMASP